MPVVHTKGSISSQGYGQFARSSAPAAVYIEDVFSTFLFLGTAATQTIANGVDLATKGGLVWQKTRNIGFGYYLNDSVRGRNQVLSSNGTSPEATFTSVISSFDNNGFTLGPDNQLGYVNFNTGARCVSWTFARQPKFFDVVTYTGNGGTQTINHSLQSAPGCIIVKRRDATTDWYVYHRSLGASFYQVLNSTGSTQTGSLVWAATTPTSTSFTVGANTFTNASGGSYVAYLFAHDAGGFGALGTDNVVSCGSYTGNGSATGPIVTLGWEPQWLLVKATSSSTQNWAIHDNMRGLSQSTGVEVRPNTGDPEYADVSRTIQVLPTGFRPANADEAINQSGGTYIYIAIRRGPMRVPTAGTSVFEPFVNYTSIADRTNGTMGPVDMAMQTQVPTPISTYNWTTFDRLRGSNVYLLTGSNSAETTGSSAVSFDTNQGVKNGVWFTAGGVGYNFKRAPGFFDVVCYTGTGSAQAVTHNLGVVPELIISKTRATVVDWGVYSAPTGRNQVLRLNLANAVLSASNIWGASGPTSTSFGVSTTGSSINNGSGETYVAYLFASCPGVSKVGSYTGTGSTVQVNCGFTAGARFVLIKRTDASGDWYVWDSARGIVAANDPYLLLNSNAAEVTNTDWVDTLATGFEVSNAGSNLVNVNGGTYLFLAIA